MISDKEQEVISRISYCMNSGEVFVVKNVFDNVLPIDNFVNLLNLKPFTNTKRMLLCHDHGTSYGWPADGWNTDPSSIPSDIVQKMIDKGMCYFCDASRASKKINSICHAIEQETLRICDCHIYFAKSSSHVNSFGIHKDYQHNLIVQTHGKTKWKVGTKLYKDFNTHPQNINEFYADDILSVDLVLDEGDAVFIPAFIYHQSESNITKRISCSFAINTLYPETKPPSRNWVEW
jgi:hypothetical protein